MPTPTRTNRILSITTRVHDRMTPALKAARIALKLLRTTAIGTFRAIAAAARLAGRAIKAMLGPIGLLLTALSGFAAFRIVKIATEVEQRVREIGTLLPGITGPALDQLSRDIREVAVEGGQAFEDEFKAAYDAISAGVAPERLLDFLRTANQLAVGGVTDVGTAVDLLTGTLNAFGKDASEAERFADALFTTVRKGKTTITELAEGIGQVSSIAAAAGLSIEETGAAMAALTLTLGDTNLASTQLKAALSVLVKLSDQQKKAAREIADGLDLSLSALQTKGLVPFLEEFNEKTQGSLDTIGKIIPNIRAVSGLAILAKDNAAAFGDAMEAMGDNVGAAASAFDLMADTAGQTFRQLRTTIADIAVEIGDAFLPLLREAAERLRDWLQDNRDNFRAWAEDIARSIEFAIRAIGPLRQLVRDLFTDPAEVSNLGAVLQELGSFALTIVRETAIAAVRIIFEVIRASFRSFVDVVGILAEQAGARFVARFRNELKVLGALPLEIGVAIRETLGDELAVAAGVAFPGLAPLLQFTREDLDAIKAGIRNAVDEAADVAEERLLAAEDIIGQIGQDIAGNLADAVTGSGSAIVEASANIAAALDQVIARFTDLAPDSPAIARYLEALQAIRDDMAGLGAEAMTLEELLDEVMASADEAARRAAEQQRRAAEGTAATAAAAAAGGGPAFDPSDPKFAERIRRDIELIERATIQLASGRRRSYLEAQAELRQTKAELLELFRAGEISLHALQAALEGAMAEFEAATIAMTGNLLDGIGAAFEALEAQIELPYEAGFRLITELAGAAERSFDSAIDSAVQGTFDLGNALESLGREALAIFAKIAAKQAALAITRFFFPGFGFAAGGIPPGPLLPFDRFQAGGITRAPSLALIGEGRQREAVVPLPDGRTIPAIVREPEAEPPVQVVNNFSFEVLDSRGVKQVLQEEAETIRNVVAAGVNERRDFRTQVRGKP